MHIILVRHASAVSEEVAGSDRDRWLDDVGRQSARVLARLLREHGVAPAAMLCSPLPRATQTAELLAGALDFLGVVESWRALEPSAQPQVAARKLGPLASAAAGPVIVVSHEPMVSNLGALLLGRPGFPPFRTAQAMTIVDGKPAFTLRGDNGSTAALFVE
jgi:phosphohistidine phosphatase